VKKLLIILSLVFCGGAYAQPNSNAPWGYAETLKINYPAHKVIYDLTTGDPTELNFVLSRISYLNRLYGSDPFDSSIVVIIHEKALPYFAIEKYKENEGLMKRARNLTIGTTIEFRMCQASATYKGYAPKDIHGFVKMVPMADAEIIRLQLEEGYAYIK